MSLLVLVKLTLTFLLCMIVGVHLGNSIWDYNMKIMPWWFKITLAGVAIAFFACMFVTILMGIWSI